MALTKEEEALFAQRLAIYRTDFAAFAWDMFETILTPKQIEYAEAFLNNKRVTFKGGTGFGKTHVMAISVWWSLICLTNVKVSIFGPTEAQLVNGLWNEVELLYSKMPAFVQSAFDVTATGAERKVNGSACYAAWRTVPPAEKIGSIAGIHADNNFIFVDEAADVDDIAFDKALQNHLLSDPNPKLILVSNPRKASGFFYDTWNGDASHLWAKVHGRLQDGRNFKEEDLIAATAQFGGKGSNAYTINVEGDFPTNDEEGLIPASLIELAVDRKDVGLPSPSRPKLWGVDPAGPGRDRSVVVKRHDNRIYEQPVEYRGLNTTQLAMRVRDMWIALPPHERENVIIAVDANGLGRGVADALDTMGVPVTLVMSQSSPTRRRNAKEQFAKLRDQMWWQVKEWFESEDVSIPYCMSLIKELKGPTWAYDSRGKTKVEGKDEMKKRLKMSPDYADALCLTFAVDEKRYVGKYAWKHSITPDDLRWAE